MNSKIKILYVDDEKLNLRIFESYFTDEYEIFTALNGYRGLEILNENPGIIAVFSDMQMPDMEGVEFIRTAKEKHPEKKYSLVTGYSCTSPIIQEAIETKLISTFIRKPLSKIKLIEIINETVNV